ncbi:hypothetical protein D9M71_90430 [compost metagenome]
MLSMHVSVITRNWSWGRPSRRARIATCCCDSSPVTYSAGMRVAMLHNVCRRMVDLPMPGSPPINTTEPSTSPPPNTRSSSALAVVKRGISSMLTSARVLICACCPAQPVRPLGGAAAPLSIMVSTRVFQAPHSPHWPAHLGKVAPHSVQPYMRLALAISLPACKSSHDSRWHLPRGRQAAITLATNQSKLFGISWVDCSSAAHEAHR